MEVATGRRRTWAELDGEVDRVARGLIVGGREGRSHSCLVAELRRLDWMHTGDLAVMRPDGYCNSVGRIKEMVIRWGRTSTFGHLLRS